jgi:hypothetical protein
MIGVINLFGMLGTVAFIYSGRLRTALFDGPILGPLALAGLNIEGVSYEPGPTKLSASDLTIVGYSDARLR